MKRTLFTIIAFLGMINLSAQQMPIDFSDASDNFSTWGGASFAIVPSPTDSNNFTGEFFRSASTAAQGFFIDLSQPIDLNQEDEITLRFYAFDANSHNIAMVLENGTNPNIEVQSSVVAQNTWVDMIFDFSMVNGTGQYSRLVIRIDDGSSIPGAFRIDDINDGSIPGNENEIDIVYTDLVWSDEFDGSSLDTSKWHFQTFGPNNGQWFNGEVQHYTDSSANTFVSNGELNIVAKKETTTQNGVTLDYTSARLNSKFAFTYGRVDVRAKLPEGDGTWPAIWTLGKNINETGAYWQTQGFGTTSWPACGEIDIMEHGLHATNEISWAIHTPSSSGNTVNTDKLELPDVSDNYHVYSVNWSPNQITFLVDNVGYYTYNPAVKDANTWPFDLDQYLILNVAMGGFAGPIDPNFTEGSMIIDYVRVYQNVLNAESFTTFEVNVYPNPSKDILNIDSQTKIESIRLYDITGKVVFQSNNIINGIDVKKFKSGIYILSLVSEKGTSNQKILIEK